MLRTEEDNQLLTEIGNLTQKGQKLKHEGKINDAVKLLENSIEHFGQMNDLPPEGMAALKKSIAKLHYLQRNYKKAAMEYIEAFKNYSFNVADGGIDENGNTCIFHLGCCSVEFHSSPFAAGYFQEIQSGGKAPGAPGSLMTPEVVVKVAEWGMKIYNEHHNEVKVTNPRVCPICKKSDQTLNIISSLFTGVQKVENGWLFNAWATTFDEQTFLGEKPKNREEGIKWGRAKAREDISFYCFRCGSVFYTEDGTKKYSTLNRCKEMFYQEGSWLFDDKEN
jgi:hypothetical protein